MRKKYLTSGIVCWRVVTGPLQASLRLWKSVLVSLHQICFQTLLCYKRTGLFNEQSKCTHQKHSEFVLAIYFIHITKRFADHLFKAVCSCISTPGMYKPVWVSAERGVKKPWLSLYHNSLGFPVSITVAMVVLHQKQHMTLITQSALHLKCKDCSPARALEQSVSWLPPPHCVWIFFPLESWVWQKGEWTVPRFCLA